MSQCGGRRGRRLFGAVLAMSLAAAACSADTELDVGSAPVATATPDANDPVVAEQLLLDDAILGDGWSAIPRDEDEDPEQDAQFREIARATPACDRAVEAGVLEEGVELIADAPTRLESPTWTRQNDEVEFTVSIFQTVDAAIAPFRLLEELGLVDCYRDLFPALLTAVFDEPGSPPVTLGEIDFAELAIAGVDDDFRITLDLPVTLDDSGGELTLGLELSAMRRDRTVVASNIVQLSGSVDGDAIVGEWLTRLDDVLGG